MVHVTCNLLYFLNMMEFAEILIVAVQNIGVYMVYVTSSLLYSLNMMEFAETPVVAVQICS